MSGRRKRRERPYQPEIGPDAPLLSYTPPFPDALPDPLPDRAELAQLTQACIYAAELLLPYVKVATSTTPVHPAEDVSAPGYTPSPDDLSRAAAFSRASRRSTPQARQTAAVLARIPRNWSAEVLREIDTVALEWIKDAPRIQRVPGVPVFDIDWDETSLYQDAQFYLAMLCPQKHFDAAMTELDYRQIKKNGDAPPPGTNLHDWIPLARARLEARALQRPLPVLHAAAAQTACLARQATLVPDTARKLDALAARIRRFKAKLRTG